MYFQRLNSPPWKSAKVLKSVCPKSLSYSLDTTYKQQVELFLNVTSLVKPACIRTKYYINA